MVDYGGKRFDFPTTSNFTPGENRTLEITVVDEADAPIGSFVGWEFEFFLLLNDTFNGLTALRANALADIENAAIFPLSTAPDCVVPLAPGDIPIALAKNYWYELWRVDAGNIGRLAYGVFPTIN